MSVSSGRILNVEIATVLQCVPADWILLKHRLLNALVANSLLII